MELIRGVGHACETLRLDMIFHITNGYNPLASGSSGGIIFADIIENRRQVEAALDVGTPCMVINNVVDDLDVNYIGIDNVAGGQLAADYLVSLGHKRIATVTGSLQTQAGKHRLDGFKQILEKQNVPLRDEYFMEGDYSRRSARLAIEKLLALKEPPTAIFVASDEMALEVITVIMENNLKVPEDISIIGFDDNPASIYGSIALTTIKQPLFQMAETAVKHLNNIILGKKKSLVQTVLTPQLIIRDSCAFPKGI